MCVNFHAQIIHNEQIMQRGGLCAILENMVLDIWCFQVVLDPPIQPIPIQPKASRVGLFGYGPKQIQSI
ncbi:hypothetical protein Hanom_Chr04g00330571 [Helianthus anomalus]